MSPGSAYGLWLIAVSFVAIFTHSMAASIAVLVAVFAPPLLVFAAFICRFLYGLVQPPPKLRRALPSRVDGPIFSEEGRFR